MADISKPVLTARPRQMPIPAEPFLHGTEKVAGAFFPPTQRFPLLVSVRVFLLAETVQTCYFSEAFGRPGLRHAIGPMTKAMRKRMKASNKSESVQKAVLSAGEGGENRTLHCGSENFLEDHEACHYHECMFV